MCQCRHLPASTSWTWAATRRTTRRQTDSGCPWCSSRWAFRDILGIVEKPIWIQNKGWPVGRLGLMAGTFILVLNPFRFRYWFYLQYNNPGFPFHLNHCTTIQGPYCTLITVYNLFRVALLLRCRPSTRTLAPTRTAAWPPRAATPPPPPHPAAAQSTRWETGTETSREFTELLKKVGPRLQACEFSQPRSRVIEPLCTGSQVDY